MLLVSKADLIITKHTKGLNGSKMFFLHKRLIEVKLLSWKLVSFFPFAVV